uniref:Uncharacterized protein n=1 Tax=Oryza rufipogon TaxID=4529 RepID=A0A0E0PNA1_ORYRU
MQSINAKCKRCKL